MSSSPDRKPNRWRRRAAWLLVFCLLLPFGLYATRGKTLYPIVWKLLTQQARSQGWALSAGRIEGNAWSEIRLIGLLASPLQGNSGTLRDLRLEHAQARFRLLDLVRFGASGLDGIHAQGLSLRIDLDAGSTNAPDKPARLPVLPHILPGLLVEDVQIEVTRGQQRLQASNLRLEIGPGPGLQQLRLDAPNLMLKDPDTEQRFDLTAHATWNEARLEDGILSIDDVPWVEVEELDLRASDQGEAHLSASLELYAEQARIQVAWLDQAPSFTAHIRSMRLEELPLSAFLDQAPQLAGLASIEIEAQQSAAGWNLAGRIQAFDLQLDGRELGDLETLGSWAPEGLSLSKLNLEGQVGKVFASDLFIPVGAVAAGTAFDEAEGQIRIDSSNLGALLNRPNATSTDAQTFPPHHLHFEGAVTGGRLQLQPGWLRISKDVGSAEWEGGWVDLSPRDGQRDLSLEVALICEDLGAATALLGVARTQGKLNGSLQLSGNLKEPVGSLELNASELQAGALSLDRVHLHATSQRGDLRMERLALNHAGQDILTLAGHLPLGLGTDQIFAEGDLDLDATLAWPNDLPLEIPQAWGSGQISGAANGTLHVGGSWKQLEVSARLQAPSITSLDGQLAPILGGAAAQFQADLEWIDNQLRVTQIEVNCKNLQLEASGQVPLSSDIPALLDQPIPWTELPLELKGSAGCNDLAWCSELSESLLRSSGQVQASFDIRGNLSKPEGNADIDLHQASARLIGLPPIESLQGSLTLRGDRWTLEELSGELGKGVVRLSGSLAPSASEAWDLRLQGTEALLYRAPTSRVRTDLDLTLQGALNDPLLSGTLGLRRVRIRENVDFLGLLSGRSGPRSQASSTTLVLSDSGPLADLRVDVVVNTVEPIEFLSNVATAGMRGSIRLEGRASGLLPSGDLFLDPSVLKLPGGTLNLTGGLVRFDPAHPAAPQIDVNGEARLAGYDITVHATGDATAPQIDLSSSPVLPVDQVLLLLLSGQVPTEGGGTGLSTARSLTVYLAKDFFSKLSGSDDDGSESWLDRLEIVTGQEVSRSGLTTLEATYRLGKKDKDAKRNWYVIAERDRYEDVNFGVRLVVRLR